MGWQTAVQGELLLRRIQIWKAPVAYYNEESGVDDTNPDKGIFYKYPVDGTNRYGENECRKRSGNTWNRYPLFRFQPKPFKFLKIPLHQLLKNVTGKTEINQKEDLVTTADADDNLIG